MNRILPYGLTASLLAMGGFPSGTARQIPPPLREPQTGIEFVRVPPGTFRMGCSEGDGQCEEDEKPAHDVRFTRAFEIGRYEVTQAQWRGVMNGNPSTFQSDDRPVENVSWNDAVEFLNRLSARNDGYRYRLPTEAEWEYAARAGGGGPRAAADLDTVAWFGAGSDRTMPAGRKKPNAWGLYDTEGNVWEWVQDWYGKTYTTGGVEDPVGPTNGDYRVLRGGAWGLPSYYLRFSFRDGNPPTFKDNSSGFRAAREPR